MKKTITRRITAVIGATALGVLSAVSLALPASAVGPDLDPNASGSITIHKYEQPLTNGAPADGTEQTVPATHVPIDGVVFSITPVTGVDLTTNAGWTTAKTLSEALAADPLALPTPLGTPQTLPATVGGDTTIGSLPLGLYLVQEVSAPANVVSKAAPFLVTVPLPTTGAAADWNYNIHVYPKNAVAGTPTKSVDDSGKFALGSTVTWTVGSTVPVFADRAELVSYVITDTLDSRLSYTAPARISLDGTALSAADVTISTTNPVTVTFTPTGLDKLMAAPNGALSLEIDTVVTGTGSIVNTALVNVNGIESETNPATTSWVPVEITKVDGDNQAPLAGAVFAVYTTQTGGTALSFPGGITEFTSDSTGKITIPGLKAGEVYWLEEVTAPTGYFGLGERVRVPGSGTLAAVPGVNTGELVTYTQTVANDKIPAWMLPLTGSTGTLLFALGGGALVAVAIGAALVVSRKKKALA
ncbi:SpaH/EbpB family LPXTG-anchored major pilin [Lysinibacter cavernae]|uniref:Fimbrial isopeptide formation D2 family protein/LPXTG-motif cell wall-anchored protein n=1 Tax=Lysinibacter cavernae TaxID=1640652 RepID=A0A7X5R153_9MICO|nr:SpaH/EbpB family LPXTG-anchored major pilin [Lysinibacter cavernae]NIH53683.1 fimbrial isopeptide formation D2 family protein/LPXTG-motif cell wall-anchored protein [Lysinibacter cavernae]